MRELKSLGVGYWIRIGAREFCRSMARKKAVRGEGKTGERGTR